MQLVPTLDLMSLLTRPRSPVRYALWLSGLLVVLGGLFGMHGLDNHGGDHGAAMDPMAHTTMTVSAHGAASRHDAMGVTAHTAASFAVVTTGAAAGGMTDSSGPTGLSMGAAGTCMAVLVLSLFLLILRLYASRVLPLLWLVARPLRSTRVRGRDPDPPSLIRLSIQRC